MQRGNNMGPRSEIQHLVFDMGGVLVDIDWHGQMSDLLGRDIAFDQIHALWGASDAVHRFETGQSDFDRFTLNFIEEQGLETSPAEFQQAFRAIIIDVFPGVTELLQALKPHFTLSLLSNTNAAHWAQVQSDYDFIPLFDHPFTSLDFGLMKPDPAIYLALLDKLQATPSSVLFFDDGAANVEAARALGIHAERVFNPDDIRQVLIDNKLI